MLCVQNHSLHLTVPGHIFQSQTLGMHYPYMAMLGGKYVKLGKPSPKNSTLFVGIHVQYPFHAGSKGNTCVCSMHGYVVDMVPTTYLFLAVSQASVICICVNRMTSLARLYLALS